MNTVTLKTITIEELYIVLSDKLRAMNCMTAFYIGKTMNVETRGRQHSERDNLPITEQLAFGNPKTIKNGEKYLIKRFMNDIRFCKNINIGGGNPDADKLYVSYRCDMINVNSIDELDDDDMMWTYVYHLI